MTSNQTYWIQRAERRIDKYTLAAFDVAKNIRRAYSSLQTYIESEMAKILRHIGEEDSLAYEYRMRRLAALLNNTEEKFKEVYGINLATTTAFLKEIVPEAYYHTIFDLAQGAGVQPEFAAIPDRLVNKIINENWSGKNYSKRIWANTEELAAELREVLTEAAVSGESIGKTSRKISEKFDQSSYNARRLIRTETTYVCNQAELGAYKELEIERYMYVATYAEETCVICQKNNNKVFPVDKGKAGVNLPPMHPHCRCTTIAYFDDEGMPVERLARDKDGKNITIPANMSYDDWYKKYIEPYKKQKAPKKLPKPKKEKPVEVPAVTPAEVQVSKAQSGDYIDTPIPKRRKQ